MGFDAWLNWFVPKLPQGFVAGAPLGATDGECVAVSAGDPVERALIDVAQAELEEERLLARLKEISRQQRETEAALVAQMLLVKRARENLAKYEEGAR